MAEFNFTVAKNYSYEDFKKTVVKGPVELRQVVVGVGDASWEMHRLHDVLQFFETLLKNRIVKNWKSHS